MDDRLRQLWDFSDLDATERRLRAQAEAETSDAGRAEVLTQLARVQGLRSSFDEADRILHEAADLAGEAQLVATRVALERGRVRRSSGDVVSAFPLFESAFESAVDGGQWALAADAAHMVALAAPDRPTFRSWTARGLELAEEHESARYWAGPLLNNLGWHFFDAREYEPALDAFERALVVRERAGDEGPIQIARYAVGKTLRALGRFDEAIMQLEPAVAWANAEGTPDGWFHEELAEIYAGVGRVAEAQTQAKLAIPLLREADSGFALDASRVSRLQLLAGESPGSAS